MKGNLTKFNSTFKPAQSDFLDMKNSSAQTQFSTWWQLNISGVKWNTGIQVCDAAREEGAYLINAIH